ncbi:MAG: hypothetical protein IT446_04925 [Phycisphaerales bacterium]|nr:hypothetical protein [Phycisphaerales bacterium]
MIKKEVPKPLVDADKIFKLVFMGRVSGGFCLDPGDYLKMGHHPLSLIYNLRDLLQAR